MAAVLADPRREAFGVIGRLLGLAPASGERQCGNGKGQGAQGVSKADHGVRSLVNGDSVKARLALPVYDSGGFNRDGAADPRSTGRSASPPSAASRARSRP